MPTDPAGSVGRGLTLFLMGSGGDGVITAGDLLARAAAHDGLSCRLTKSFGPQIRGGESAVWLQLDTRPVRAPAEAADVVLVFSWRSLPQFRAELRFAEGAIVLQDEADEGNAPTDLVDVGGRPVRPPLSVPLRRIAEEEAGTHLGRNVVAVGFLAGLLGLPADTVPDALERRFRKKGANVFARNVRAFQRGRGLGEEDRFVELRAPPLRGDGSPQLLMTGNDAVALGALRARLDLFAGYPITPASEILSCLAAQLPATGGTVIQAEDEIAAMSMVIGASFGGKKAMTATSGPGLSLMVEAIGLASQAEIPCVIIDVQRGGPSTGMPTRTEQGDLHLALYGAHGDAPRVVLAAEDVASCFSQTVRAFSLAERFQTPVILLTDQAIGHREESLPADALTLPEELERLARRRMPEPNPEEPYLRFVLGDDPVSPMSAPGIEGCAYNTSGIVHTESGSPTSAPAVHQAMSEKLARKMALVAADYEGWRVAGDAEAPRGIVTWGSTTGSAVEAAAALGARGRPTAVLVVSLLSPLPVAAITRFVGEREQVAVVDLSFSGQLARVLRAEGVALAGATLVHRAGGQSFTAGELVERLEEAWS